MANIMLPINSSSLMPTLPIATPMHSTFFNWNLMVDLTSSILAARSSLCETGVGNFPALERPGPRRRGICLMRASDETKASYLRASFLMSFLFLLSFFKSCHIVSTCFARRGVEHRLTSVLMASTPWCLARSISCWSPRTQMAMPTLYCQRSDLTLVLLVTTYEAWGWWAA
jgi:hypothetical protein